MKRLIIEIQKGGLGDHILNKAPIIEHRLAINVIVIGILFSDMQAP